MPSPPVSPRSLGRSSSSAPFLRPQGRTESTTYDDQGVGCSSPPCCTPHRAYAAHPAPCTPGGVHPPIVLHACPPPPRCMAYRWRDSQPARQLLRQLPRLRLQRTRPSHRGLRKIQLSQDGPRVVVCPIPPRRTRRRRSYVRQQPPSLLVPRSMSRRAGATRLVSCLRCPLTTDLA